MHPALDIADIVSLICEAAGTIGFSPRELLNLALTSSAFSSLALDVAWGQRRLDFGDLCYSMEISQEDSSEFEDDQILDQLVIDSSSSWERLFFYASKIRNIAVDMNHVPSFVSSMVANKQADSATSLFPRMENLEITLPFGCSGWSFLRTFCGPNLSTLRINLPQLPSEEDLAQLVVMPSLIHSICPQVINLVLHGPGSPFLDGLPDIPGLGAKSVFAYDGLWSSTLSLISHMDGLRNINLALPYILSAPDCAERLSRLPRLEALVLHQLAPYCGSTTEQKANYLTKADKSSFRVLRKLDLAGCTPFLRDFLDVLSLPRLETMHLELLLRGHDSQHEAKVLHGVITSFIGSQSPPACLRGFKLNMRKTEDYYMDDMFAMSNVMIPTTFLRPLFAFSSLQDLELYSEIEFGIDNAQVEALASAWPKLRRLILPSQTLGTAIPSLFCLHTLASLCQELVELSIVTEPESPFTSRPFNMPSCEHPLRLLRIRLVETSSYANLADWVQKLFPSAEIDWIIDDTEMDIYDQRDYETDSDSDEWSDDASHYYRRDHLSDYYYSSGHISDDYLSGHMSDCY